MRFILACSVVACAPTAHARDLIDIPGGQFVMGDAEGDPNEKPRAVTIAPFRIARYEVTNAEFEVSDVSAFGTN